MPQIKVSDSHLVKHEKNPYVEVNIRSLCHHWLTRLARTLVGRWAMAFKRLSCGYFAYSGRSISRFVHSLTTPPWHHSYRFSAHLYWSWCQETVHHWMEQRDWHTLFCIFCVTFNICNIPHGYIGFDSHSSNSASLADTARLISGLSRLFLATGGWLSLDTLLSTLAVARENNHCLDGLHLCCGLSQN